MRISFENNELRIDSLLCFPVTQHPQYVCRVDGTIWSLKGKAVKKLKPAVNKNTGYNTIKLDGKTYNAHYIFCSAFHGPKPSKMHQVAHYNAIKTDNSAMNLRWTTAGEKKGFPKENGFFDLTNSMDSLFHYHEKQGNLTGRLQGFENKYTNGRTN